MTGLRINAKKSCWCTCPHRPSGLVTAVGDLPLIWESGPVRLHKPGARRAITIGGELIPQVSAATCLGANLRADPTEATIMQRRIGRAKEMAGRLARLPVTLGRQAELAGMLLLPTGLYGGIVEDPEAKEVQALARAVEGAVGGSNDWNLRAVPLSLSLIRKGHVVDPPVYLHYNRLLAWRRLCVKGRGDIEQVVQPFRPKLTPKGPAAIFARTLHDIGWRWVSSTVLDIPSAIADYLPRKKREKLGLAAEGAWRRLDLREVSGKQQVGIYAHMVREALRRWRWQMFARSSRRPDLRLPGENRGWPN